METEEKQEKGLALFEELKNDLIVTDGSEYNVPVAKVFGHGTLAKTESFGGKSLVENSQKVDLALAKTDDLQHIWNRSHSQWSWKHINLSYLSPEKNMRQIAAEISRKKAALNEAKWKQVKNEIKIKKLEEKLANGLEYWEEVETKVKLLQLKEGMAEGMVYVEGAMKDILALSDMYDQLSEKMGEFTEDDIEKNESKAHLKRSVVQCIRDVRMSGSITKGEQEYLEQIGVNPSRMLQTIRQYVAKEAQSDSWDTGDLFDFVDSIVEELIEHLQVDKKRLDKMGFSPELTEGVSTTLKIGHKPEETEE
jgi:hypothetical protein